MFEPRDHQLRLWHKYAFSVWQPRTSCLKTSELAFGANTLVWCANAPVWCANAPGMRSAGSKTFTVFVLPLAESTSSLSHRRGIAGLVIDDFCIIPQRLSSRGRVGTRFNTNSRGSAGKPTARNVSEHSQMSPARHSATGKLSISEGHRRKFARENSQGKIRKARLWIIRLSRSAAASTRAREGVAGTPGRLGGARTGSPACHRNQERARQSRARSRIW
jgi:hypothetical protein